jgi:hypothetical protein
LGSTFIVGAGRQSELRIVASAHLYRDHLAEKVPRVFAPLEKELMGAIKAPAPPFQRLFNQLGDIRAPEQLAAAAVVGPGWCAKSATLGGDGEAKWRVGEPRSRHITC